MIVTNSPEGLSLTLGPHSIDQVFLVGVIRPRLVNGRVKE